MIKQTITWNRPTVDTPWPWEITPTETFAYIDMRMNSEGFLDFIPSETDLEFVAVILWEAQEFLDAHMNTDAHNNMLRVHNAVMEEYGVTKTITIEDMV